MIWNGVDFHSLSPSVTLIAARAAEDLSVINRENSTRIALCPLVSIKGAICEIGGAKRHLRGSTASLRWLDNRRHGMDRRLACKGGCKLLPGKLAFPLRHHDRCDRIAD